MMNALDLLRKSCKDPSLILHCENLIQRWIDLKEKRW